MKKLKKEYDNIVLERTKILEEINELKENEFVKKYLELNDKNHQLRLSQERALRELKLMEYENCEHIWVISKAERDAYQGWSCIYRGCIKCGYDQALIEYNQDKKFEFLSAEDKAMIEYFKRDKGFALSRGIKTNINFDFVLAKHIYKTIKEAHPRASDKTIIKLLEKEIDKIKNDNVSQQSGKKRTKNLK